MHAAPRRVRLAEGSQSHRWLSQIVRLGAGEGQRDVLPPLICLLGLILILSSACLKFSFRVYSVFVVQGPAAARRAARVVKWLRKAGPVDALCSVTVREGLLLAFSLLHTAASQRPAKAVEMVVELLQVQRGVSVDLPSSLGTSPRLWMLWTTATPPSCSSSCSTRPTPRVSTR